VAELRPIALSALGFILLGQVTGGMLAFRAEGSYYTAYPGWTLFSLVGFLSGQLQLRPHRARVLIPTAAAIFNPAILNPAILNEDFGGADFGDAKIPALPTTTTWLLSE